VDIVVGLNKAGDDQNSHMEPSHDAIDLNISDTVSEISFAQHDVSALSESAASHSRSSYDDEDEDEYMPSGKGKKCSPILRNAKRPIENKIKRK
jgi:hypothetical protein